MNIYQDFHQAWRSLSRDRSFSIAAVLTLALGIWSVVSIFSIADSVLLRPFPFEDPQRLVEVTEGPTLWLAPPEYFILRESGVFEHTGAYRPGGKTLTGAGDPAVIRGAQVTPDLFATLGVRPIHGRTFTAEETPSGNERLAVIGYGLWQRRFAGDPGLIGRAVTLDGEPFTILGVMPSGFRFPVQWRLSELWTPLALNASGSAHNTAVVARLHPGPEEATQERLTSVAARFTDDVKHQDFAGFEISPLAEAAVGEYRLAFGLLFAAVATVLMIACTNVANLMLVRSAGRRREIAVRRALGAGALRLIRQSLAESLLLSFLGGLLGLILASATLDLLVKMSPAALPRLDEVSIDHRVAFFTLAVALAASLIAGMAPALQSFRWDCRQALRPAGNPYEGLQLSRLRSALVVSQVALAMLLLVGAGLMMRSLWLLLNINPGMKTEHVLTMALPLEGPRYREEGARKSLLERLLSELRALPGVESASLAEGVPLSGGGVWYGFTKHDDETQGLAGKYAVASDFFEALGIPILRGRGFDQRDGAGSQRVAVVNQAMADKYWPSGADPLGRLIVVEGERDPREIIGIVGNVKRRRVEEADSAEMYLPMLQVQQFFLSYPTLAVRSSSDPTDLTAVIRDRIRQLDPALPLTNVRTLKQVHLESLAWPRFRGLLLGIFALLALVLAAVGLYGVVSYSGAQRTREFGVRMALGARSADLGALILRQSLLLTALGLMIGIGASLGLTRFLEGFLYGITPTDPATFLVVSGVLAASALTASLAPARRASKVDPAESLRYE